MSVVFLSAFRRALCRLPFCSVIGLLLSLTVDVACAAEYGTLGVASKDCQDLSPSISIDDSTAVVGGALSLSVTSRPNSVVQVAATSQMSNVSVGGVYVPTYDITAYVLPSPTGTGYFTVSIGASGTGTLSLPLPSSSVPPWTEFTFQAVASNGTCANDKISTSAAKIANIRPPPGPSVPRSSVTQNGITWTFSTARPTGQFANGDWWVVGPVTITSINPPTVSTNGVVRNGSMLNPVPNALVEIGYGSDVLGGPFNFLPNGASRYKASLNMALNLPLALQPNNSLVSTISNTSTSGTADAAVLTVLSQAAPADAFRAPYSGTDKTLRFGVGGMQMSKYKNLVAPSNAPSIGSMLSKFETVVLRHGQDWAHYLMQVTKVPRYYRDRDNLFYVAVNRLNTDNSTASEKLELAKRLIQIGIDYNALVLEGQTKNCTTGHCNGFAFPIIHAGHILNSARMFWIAKLYHYNFQGPNHPQNRDDGFTELGQYFTVQQTGTTSGGAPIMNHGYGGYGFQHLNLPEWGNFHSEPGGIQSDDVRFDEGPTGNGANPYRNCCSANGHAGLAIAVRIMGIQEALNNPVLLRYMDRYLEIQPVGAWTRFWDPFIEQMTNLYRNLDTNPAYGYSGPLFGTYFGPYS